MHIHILGICGTFMGSLAIIARQLGHKVTGSDANVYPPMSTQLTEQDIDLFEGYGSEQFAVRPDLVVVGNAMSRGNEAVEYVLNKGIAYTSGPQWLAENVLSNRWVLAVSGTHGKTTTSSMLTWILHDNGMKPGYLIGGIPANMGVSAAAGESDFFVIEADEYDSAFFDKRSKFVHYRPRTLVMNNLEFDHADIFDDLAAIQKQFHHLVRTVPSEGLLILPTGEPNLDEVLEQGAWTPVQYFSNSGAQCQWRSELKSCDGSSFDIWLDGELQGQVNWLLLGDHNVSNAMAAVVAARHIGIAPSNAIESLTKFEGVKRRMEVIGEIDGVTIYDDFAHHPTAIATTLAGLRAKTGNGRIIAVLEPRSNTMQMGVHKDELCDSVKDADLVYWYQTAGLQWSLSDAVKSYERQSVVNSVDVLVSQLCEHATAGDSILIMSNGGFEGIYKKLLAALNNRV
ncbi:MAG: UDP-N-acetylmuramate: L-alanyl-gamma-D-glutamyl-meso-diaminopimelate ligase [Porticoccus sp.]|jgi:UDP-N-acetylmuramate: L-alanyl-gamma-D-glutamyl-meso-diaminopimelate ligase